MTTVGDHNKLIYIDHIQVFIQDACDSLVRKNIQSYLTRFEYIVSFANLHHLQAHVLEDVLFQKCQFYYDICYNPNRKRNIRTYSTTLNQLFGTAIVNRRFSRNVINYHTLMDLWLVDLWIPGRMTTLQECFQYMIGKLKSMLLQKQPIHEWLDILQLLLEQKNKAIRSFFKIHGRELAICCIYDEYIKRDNKDWFIYYTENHQVIHQLFHPLNTQTTFNLDWMIDSILLWLTHPSTTFYT